VRRAVADELADATPARAAQAPAVRTDWAERRERYREAVKLRAVVSELRGAIRDGEGHELRCGVDGYIEQHVSVAGALRFKVQHCQRRDRCPADAMSYGELRGRELASVLDAAVSGRPWAHGWELEVTTPAPLHGLYTCLVDAGDVAGVRDLDRRLVRVMQAYAWALLEPDRAHRSDVGLAVSLHHFHSFNDDDPEGKGPLWPELYPHAHAYVPNERPGGGELRHRAMFSEAELAGARAQARAVLLREFGGLADLSGLGEIDVNAHFLRNDDAVTAKLAHRSTYQALHPWFDVVKQAMARPAEVYSEEGRAGLGAFADRAELLHRVKSQRFGGWLTPGQRRRHGLVREDGEKSPWRALDEDGGGYREIVGYTDTAVILRSPTWPKGEVQYFVGFMVAWGENAPPKLWCRRTMQDMHRSSA